MRNAIDRFINGTTMYRLVWLELVCLLAAAGILHFWKLMPYSIVDIAYSAAVLFAACWLVNQACARIFQAPSNPESVIITALILACIVSPIAPFSLTGLPFMLASAVLAMVSKYILAVGKRHLFNPAALGVALAALIATGSATWWVGAAAMLPFTLIGGILIVRKVQRLDLVAAFSVAAGTMAILTASSAATPLGTLWKMAVHAPAVFFATVMLTEPLTTPPGRPRRIVYGAITGVLFAPAVHFGSIYSTPELALLASNVFSWLSFPQGRYLLRFKEKVDFGPYVSDLIFEPDRPVKFRPGQYLEWTLPHHHADERGARRYFTVASAPSEPLVHIGIRFAEDKDSSTYKRSLRALAPGQVIAVSPPSGDFVMPRDPSQKLVFIAGGIGVTPFRSMVQDLIDRNERRDAVILYSNRVAEDIAYADVFSRGASLGIRTVYTLTGPGEIAADWPGRRGMLDAAAVAQEVPDYKERTFYLSGPPVMVDAFKKTLRAMGVPHRRIKSDFFPGFA